MAISTTSESSVRSQYLLEWLAVATIFLIVNVLGAIFQPPLTFMGGKAWELNVYYDIAERFRHSLPIVGPAPAIFRIGIPWLVSVLPFSDLSKSFFYINLFANACTAALLVCLLRYYVKFWKIRVVLIGFYLIHWLGPTRFLYFVSAETDATAIFLLTAGLLLIERWRKSERAVDLLRLCALVLVGTAVREIMLVIPVAFLFANKPFDKWGVSIRRLGISIAPLLCGSLVLLLIHSFVHPTESYRFASAALNWAYSKSLPVFILGCFITLGPVAVLLALDWKGTRLLLNHNSALAVFLILILFLSYCGGSDTERFMLWGAPSILILFGTWFERNRNVLRDRGLVILIILLQLISERAFWTTPDLGYSVENSMIFLTSLSSNAYYLNLYSYHAPRSVSALMLLEYAAVGTVILAWAAYRLSHKSNRSGMMPA